MQIPIKKTIERIPGGLMLVPLMTGALLTTLAPHAGAFFGSFTNGLFTGALPILAVFYVCMGAQISFRAVPQVIKRGGVLMFAKLVMGSIAASLLGHFLGVDPIHSGPLAGLSALAVVASINDTNGGLYMALMEQYGTPTESAAYSIMALEAGPFFTMISLGVAGLSSFPWPTLLGAILPLVLGIILGNLDHDLRAFLSKAPPILIPFFAFAIGATLDLRKVWDAGLTGIILGLLVVIVSSIVLIPVDRLAGGNGTAGVAAATTAGNAAAVPMLVASANPAYRNAAGPATMLVASCVIITSLLAPILTAQWNKRVRYGSTTKHPS